MSSFAYRFQLFSPADCITYSSPLPCIDHTLLSAVQRLRGNVYLCDGALNSEDLDDEGRFHMQDDDRCWHLVLLDGTNEIVGCARYLVHPPEVLVTDLSISRSPIATDSRWATLVRASIEADLASSRRSRLRVAEIGGLAIASRYRHTRAAVHVILGSFAVARLLALGVGYATATFRNNSAPILRRVGGEPLQHAGMTVPPYFDSRFGCKMELLTFRLQSCNPKFASLVDHMYDALTTSDVLRPDVDFVMASGNDLVRLAGSVDAYERIRLHPKREANSLCRR